MESKKIKVYILFFSVILESRSFLETNDPALLKSFFTSVLPHDLQETSQELQVPSQDLTTRLKPAEGLQDRSDASEETGENSSSKFRKKIKKCQENLRSGWSRSRVRRATRRESSLCLSSMKPRLEYFKWPHLKIARSHYIPTGSHQEDRGMGLGWGGRNSNTLLHHRQHQHQHQPPQTCLHLCQWHGMDGPTRGNMCDWLTHVCFS